MDSVVAPCPRGRAALPGAHPQTTPAQPHRQPSDAGRATQPGVGDGLPVRRGSNERSRSRSLRTTTAVLSSKRPRLRTARRLGQLSDPRRSRSPRPAHAQHDVVCRLTVPCPKTPSVVTAFAQYRPALCDPEQVDLLRRRDLHRRYTRLDGQRLDGSITCAQVAPACGCRMAILDCGFSLVSGSGGSSIWCSRPSCARIASSWYFSSAAANASEA